MLPAPLMSSMLRMSPAVASNEPPARRLPPSQLSSMNLTTDACVICV